MGYKKDDPCIKKAYDDERLFVLMARDPQAPEVIIKWIAHSLGNQPDDKIREALECAIEMHNTGKKFRDRKEYDDKRIAERKEREEFERWKKRQAQGEALVNAGLAMRKPTKWDKGSIVRDGEQGPEVMSHIDAAEKIQRSAHTQSMLNHDKRNLENFANWLDAQGYSNEIEQATKEAHGFARLAEEFLKSLATPVL